MYVNFWGLSWAILGRIIDARDDAAVEDVPGEECSARIVVRWAMQELELGACQCCPDGGLVHTAMALTKAGSSGALMRKP